MPLLNLPSTSVFVRNSLNMAVGLMLLVVTATNGLAQTDSVLALTPFSPRYGLPHFFQKLKKQQPVRVVYLGGSITRKDGGWRDQTFDALRQAYPTVAMEQIMAAISGTGSDFGMFRLQGHVLTYNPDLVFIEFAVNDNSRPFRQVLESMESIVRQIWTHDPATDVCFVYTLSKGNWERYRNQQFSVATSAMETIASHYQIPSVNVGTEPARLIAEGKMVLEEKTGKSAGKLVFATDGVHPLVETGHRLYTEQIMASLRTMAVNSTARRRVMPKPLSATSVLPVRWLSVADNSVERSPGWSVTDSVTQGKEFARFVPSVLTTADTTAFLRFRFTGQSFGVADVIGPGSGHLLVQIDNEPARIIKRFDNFCTYYRLNYFVINGLPQREHVVTITLAPGRIDKLAVLRTRQEIAELSSGFRYQQPFIAHLFYR